jgi:hypothetical protein
MASFGRLLDSPPVVGKPLKKTESFPLVLPMVVFFFQQLVG